MIDNKDINIASPPSEILKIIIIERRKEVIESIEAYNKVVFTNAQAPINIVRARVFSLFLEIQGALKRSLEPDEYKLMMLDIQKGKPPELIEAFIKINEWLDFKKIIRVDTIERYDSTRVEIENIAKGV